jgi:hypothetical protein
MPDHVMNFLTLIPTDGTTVKEVLSAVKCDEFVDGFDSYGSIMFNKIIPKPAKTKGGYGYWYDWRTENWGTQWDAYYDFLVSEKPKPMINETGDRIRFQTAWSPPLPVILELSRKYPSMIFIHTWYSEDLGKWVGLRVLLAGAILHDARPANNSKDAFDFIFNIERCKPADFGIFFNEKNNRYEYIDEDVQACIDYNNNINV